MSGRIVEAKCSMRLKKDYKFQVAKEWLRPIEPYDYVTDVYQKFIKGRDVVIAGGCDNFPAAYLDGNKGERVIVRINNHWQRQGGQVDILYHTTTGTNQDVLAEIAVIQQTNVSWIWLNQEDADYAYGRIKRPRYAEWLEILRVFDIRHGRNVGLYAQGTWENKNPYGAHQEWLNTLQKHYDCSLFTGMVALAHVMRQKPARVFVCGMDMFVNETGGNIEAHRDSHALKGNVSFLASMVRKYSEIITLDEPLREALNRYGF